MAGFSGGDLITARLIGWLLILQHGCLLAAPPAPFATSDRNPLVAIHGLPDQGQWFFEPAEKQRATLALDVSNTLHDETRTAESLFIDGETQWLTFRFSHVLDDNWLLQAQVPHVRHSGGRFDDFIHDFHEFFRFPDGGRPDHPSDQIDIRYSRDGQLLLDVDAPLAGWGDLRLSAAYQVDKGPQSGSAWWFQLKAANGDSDALAGSGAPSLALWGAGWRRFGSLGSYFGGGFMVLPEGDILPDQQRAWSWFARGGAEYNLSAALGLQVELATHGRFYDSDTEALGTSMQLHMGGWLAPRRDSRVQLVVSEDVRVHSAPDVVFHVSWHQSL